MFLRYYLTKEMYKQFGLYTVLNSQTFINSTKKNRLITPFFVFLICLPNWDTWGGFPGILILPGIAFLIFPLLSKSGAKGSVNQISDDKPVDEVSGENQLYVQEWTLVEISPRSRLEIPYYNVRRLVVDGNMLYIYFSTEGAIIVPFSAFRDRGELEYLINYICYKHPSLHRPQLPVQAAYGQAMTRPIPGREESSSKSKLINILTWAALVLLILFWFKTCVFPGDDFAGLNQPDYSAAMAEAESEAESFKNMVRVDDAESLRKAVREAGSDFWGYTMLGDPDSGERILVSVCYNTPDGEISEQQVAAFEYLQREYYNIKPKIMAAMVEDYKVIRAEVGGGWLSKALDIFPEINTPEEMTKHTFLAHWTLHWEHKDGIAYTGVGYSVSWTPNEPYGSGLHKDTIIYTGIDPGDEYYQED